MPHMSESGWATCVNDECFWAESGPNSWYAAEEHESVCPGHRVRVGGGYAGPPSRPDWGASAEAER